ncbi:MAG: hypothetical protein ACHQIO_05390 [Nevskiales bacterium]
MPWLRNVYYVMVALISWALTSYAYFHLLLAIKPARPLTFIVSMSLVLVVMLLGLIFEDKLIWKGYFDGRYKRYDVTVGGRRTAPPPLMMGVIGGLLVFFFW